MHTVVERELELGLLLTPERSIPVPARLAYRTDDPYAVHITFHIGSEAPVHWTFARELLVEGVFRPVGEGDVRIRPGRADGHAVIRLALRSPDGEALLQAPRRRCPPGWSGPCGWWSPGRSSNRWRSTRR